jgi:hypothetical protein
VIFNFLSKPLWGGDVGKPSVNSATLELDIDPKPSELAMSRVNSTEGWKEARTREPFNTLG